MGLFAHPRPVDPGPDTAEKRRQEGGHHQDGNEGDEHPPDAGGAQAGHGEHDESHEADGHRDPREDNRTPGGLDRPHHRIVVAGSPSSFLTPAGDQEQRVVDSYAEAYQRHQELHDERDLGQVRQPEDDQQGGEDGDRRHHEWEQGEEGGEDEGQHDQGPGRADQGLGEHPGAA